MRRHDVNQGENKSDRGCIVVHKDQHRGGGRVHVHQSLWRRVIEAHSSQNLSLHHAIRQKQNHQSKDRNIEMLIMQIE